MRTLISFVILFFSIFSTAMACDLKNWTFGDSSKDVVEKYNISGPVNILKKGSDSIVVRAKEVCSDMPAQAVAELAFIDNKFVQLKISTPENTGDLMKYAKNTFGQPDQGEMLNDTKNGQRFYSWAENNNKIVMYSVAEKFEYLEITSTLHKHLFDKLTKDESK